MDDDEEEREFSKSIVFGFFEQAEQTFEEMKEALFVPPLHIPLQSSSPNLAASPIAENQRDVESETLTQPP